MQEIPSSSSPSSTAAWLLQTSPTYLSHHRRCLEWLDRRLTTLKGRYHSRRCQCRWRRSWPAKSHCQWGRHHWRAAEGGSAAWCGGRSEHQACELLKAPHLCRYHAATSASADGTHKNKATVLVRAAVPITTSKVRACVTRTIMQVHGTSSGSHVEKLWHRE